MAYKPNETIMMHIHKTLQQKKEECLSLLRSTGRDKIEDLVTHVTRMGYFEAPGSLKHHRFVGGLLSHSLETYYKAMDLRDEKIRKGVSPDQMPKESVIIAALLHDLCKADVLRYNPETVKPLANQREGTTLKGDMTRTRYLSYSHYPPSVCFEQWWHCQQSACRSQS
jgi:hypothetical protein